MNLRDSAIAKRNTLQIYANLQKYDSYKRATQVLPKLYEHDLLFYNDSVQQRHERNKKQISKIIKAINSKQMTADMLEFNTTNTFYPSYVLHHHLQHFTKFTVELSQQNPHLKSLIPKLQNCSLIGAIFEKMINIQFKKDTNITFEGGVLKMSPSSYFYSFKTSPYVHICCVEVKNGNYTSYAFVQLRNESSQFCQGIQVRDLGATISPDYLAVAYRFNNVKPLFIADRGGMKLYRNVLSDDSVVQLGYSLQDLTNSLYVTIKYTQMRLQFPTLEKSKKQRPIGQYQAVTSRIADGFATLYGLSFLRQRLISMPQVASFMRFYLPFMHQVILERLIDLRQCCGGHGYLQISGHPGFLERVTIRSAQPALTLVPDNKQIMKRVHYYSNDDQRLGQYIKQLSPEGNRMPDIFAYFVMICIRMRQNKSKLSSRQYMKQFIRQSCIQMMYSSTYFDHVDPKNPSQNLLPYIIVKYVIQHSKFLDWQSLKVKHEQFHEKLMNLKTQLLLKISAEIPKLTQILQVGFLRNIIVGEENSENFYNKVMEASQKNKRNSTQYKDHILRNLRSLIKQQRASL